jgi:hypothetical protein
MTSEKRRLLRVYRSMIKRAAHAPRGKKQSRLGPQADEERGHQ